MFQHSTGIRTVAFLNKNYYYHLFMFQHSTGIRTVAFFKTKLLLLPFMYSTFNWNQNFLNNNYYYYHLFMHSLYLFIFIYNRMGKNFHGCLIFAFFAVWFEIREIFIFN